MIINGEVFQIDFQKKFGQNFIFDRNLLDAIAADAGVTKQDTVVEIGAGAGTLTAALADRAGQVVAYEIDEALRPVLDRTLAAKENVRVIYEDFLKKSEPLPLPFKVVANLPYYVTTPIVMQLLEGAERPESVTVMVQKEVAERLTARPGSAEYGAITASLDLVAEATITRIVGRQCFLPPPKVDSAVVRIDLVEKGYTAEEIAMARRIIRASFNMRRKTLANGLATLCGGKDRAAALIARAGFPANVRGETLSAEEYILLARSALAAL